MNMEKKITMATVKSFIKKNRELYIKCKSSFDGMTDCVEQNVGSTFQKANTTDMHTEKPLGINGAWFVGRSRDHFSEYNDGMYKGIEVYNCCGSFIIAIPA